MIVMLMIDTMTMMRTISLVMLMIVTMIIMMMISSLQHKYLNTHKRKSHSARTEFKFHLRSKITLIPNTYEIFMIIVTMMKMTMTIVVMMMVSDDDDRNYDINYSNCHDDRSKENDDDDN
jgi:uncharacterized membrane protein